MKLYMFRTVPLSIIRSLSLYTQQWHMSHRFADSLRAESGRNCSSILILLHPFHTYECEGKRVRDVGGGAWKKATF